MRVYVFLDAMICIVTMVVSGPVVRIVSWWWLWSEAGRPAGVRAGGDGGYGAPVLETPAPRAACATTPCPYTRDPHPQCSAVLTAQHQRRRQRSAPPDTCECDTLLTICALSPPTAWQPTLYFSGLAGWRFFILQKSMFFFIFIGVQLFLKFVKYC